ncbi:AraC family transcriptional regulator [Propionispora sp. 2/2-37]|uniref:AraC family transcriptional regulator n=1 Tax=Propionispora sp. 2/2-37 TaxID=1677858 RepID=UPI001F384AF9|nr:AraC family transcriptional regulator [Propionispora sp. 2/2-37]
MFREGDRHSRRNLDHTFDLIYVVSGQLYMEENKKRFIVAPGQFLILPPKTLHTGYKHCDTETNFYWIHFYTTGDFYCSEVPVQYSSKEYCRGKCYERDDFQLSLPQYGFVNKELQQQFTNYMKTIAQVKIDRHQNAKIFYTSTTSQIKYQQLFYTILTFICDSHEEVTCQDLAEDIFEYLMAHYQESLQLKKIAKQYAFHPAHIIRCVKRKYGVTPLQLLLHIRMDKAKKLLRSTNDPINTISSHVGFTDNAYFSKQFKRMVKMTPSEYRYLPFSQDTGIDQPAILTACPGPTNAPSPGRIYENP